MTTTSRLFFVLAMFAGLSTVAAAPAPAPSPSVVQRVQPPGALLVQPVTITKVELTLGGYNVTVENPALVANPAELHFKGKTIPLDVKPKGFAVVRVDDPASASLCTIGTLAFNLTGAHADPKVRHAELSAAPAYNAKGGTLSGAGSLPADATGKVAILSGGATHWYGCGQKFELSALVANDTTTTPQNLKLELYDTDGTKIGEAAAIVPSKGQAPITVKSTVDVCGRVGHVRAHLTDNSPELVGKLLSTRELFLQIELTTNPTLKLTD